MSEVTYPEMIESLPDIDIALEGVRGKLLQGEDRQVVFFDIQPIGAIPLHTHGATFTTRFKAIDVFEEPDRYRTR